MIIITFIIIITPYHTLLTYHSLLQVKALSISPADSNPSELQDSVVSTSDPSEVHIFQALYNYDPNQYSPNEQPGEELQLTAGDFVVVYGDMDEVGGLGLLK